MKVGLIRHFEVDLFLNNKLSSDEFDTHSKQYDIAKVKLGERSINPKEWDKCFSSDLPRALETATHLFNGEIRKTQLIREVPLRSAIKTKIKLHYKLWLIFGRIAWLISHKSQPESKKATETRVLKFVSEIESLGDVNILVVSHGFIMQLIKRELIKKGFRGENFIKAVNGRLYVFEK